MARPMIPLEPLMWVCHLCSQSWIPDTWKTKVKRRRFTGRIIAWHRCPNGHRHRGAEPAVWREQRTSSAVRGGYRLTPLG
ncbi:hypothetical protein GCM10027589_00910 [Actinocorallia lasiicapitis]